MEPRDASAQRRHQLGRQSAARGHAIEQPLLVEAAHHDQPVDGIVRRPADLAQEQLSFAAQHRRDAEINLGRRPPVDVDLGGAHRGAPAFRREVHVGKLHSPLQFVRTLATEEDDRAVRVDPPLRIQLGFEEGDGLGLVLDDE
jgi:hypothetical protein